MSVSTSITLRMDSAVPHGNAQDSQRILALWQAIDAQLRGVDFIAQGQVKAAPRRYRIDLDAGALVTVLSRALEAKGSFDAWRQAHVDDPAHGVDAVLTLGIASGESGMPEGEAYQVATLFLQQLVMACNVVLPGSIQLLGARFEGEGAYRFEAQSYDSRIFYGALKTAANNGWPVLATPDFATVWQWLQHNETSHSHTAITTINKVLYTLLKVAEQRHEYSARTVLLVLYQLEVLLDCRNATSHHRIRQHANLILGRIPAAGDPFKELYEVRNSLFMGDQPVHRPPLICHNTAEVLKEQVGQHNSAVETGTVLVLVLLHDLIAHEAQGYDFSEVFTHKR